LTKTLERVPIDKDWNDFSSERVSTWHCIVGQMEGFPNYVAGVELFKIIHHPTDSLFETKKLHLPDDFFLSEWGNDVYWEIDNDLHSSWNSLGEEEQDIYWQIREAVTQYKRNFPRDFNYKGAEASVME